MGERLCFSVWCLAIEGHVSGRYIKKSGAEGFSRMGRCAGALKCKRESKPRSITGLNTKERFYLVSHQLSLSIAVSLNRLEI